ncbi:hypothetical protein EPI10_011289 [Gossypium australe]|uniref:Uncharacterized protein n=1 Tax=Gossypium australe TaxID=47621 RepID=A0A5B6W6W7_9ROSI|nr:hypothetical protein EPI10_011289 [Gossypium australe]
MKSLETFHKFKVNIPLLDAIKQVPHYTKFLKELCIGKKKLLGNERVSIGENVFTVLQNKFCLSIRTNTMCDLGAPINVMHLSIYKLLNTGPLKKKGLVVYPEGVFEEVLVKVNKLIFPTDFYIIVIEDDNSTNSSDILLGRPFFSTTRMKIDVWNRTFTIEFDSEVVKFNACEAMGHLSAMTNVFSVDIIEQLTNLHFEYHEEDELKIMLCRSLDLDAMEKLKELLTIKEPIREAVIHIEAS